MFLPSTELLSAPIWGQCDADSQSDDPNGGQGDDYPHKPKVIAFNLDTSAGSHNVYHIPPCEDKNTGGLTIVEQTLEGQQTSGPALESSVVPSSFDSLTSDLPIASVASSISSVTPLTDPEDALPTPLTPTMPASVLPILSTLRSSTSIAMGEGVPSDVITLTTISPSIMRATITTTTLVTSADTTIMPSETYFDPAFVPGELSDPTMNPISTAEASHSWTSSTEAPLAPSTTHPIVQDAHKTVSPLAIILPVVFTLLFICGLLIWWLRVRRREKKRRDHLAKKAEWFNDDHINRIRQKMEGVDPEKTGTSDHTLDSTKLDKNDDSNFNLPSSMAREAILEVLAKNQSSCQRHGPADYFEMKPSQIESAAAADLSNPPSPNSSMTGTTKSPHVDVPTYVRRGSSPESSARNGLVISSASCCIIPTHSRVTSGAETTISRHDFEQDSETQLLAVSSTSSSASEAGNANQRHANDINMDLQERRQQSDLHPLERRASRSSNLSAKQTLSHKLNRGFERAMRRRNGLEELNR
ncbi:hypothetical protein PV10_06780 [Exophiala mesophila]|uniref:Uncharacterized protein n=1 Tax=Exophiala mesophila TaxID=212818 RepID=A0A0D1ZZT0_EXOME|nr:uncharacterized protein PV10_06780 [Exophiala mesophila]KIV92328.1 hypothetical protein PV10_06780 [Exophiala mesophila]